MSNLSDDENSTILICYCLCCRWVINHLHVDFFLDSLQNDKSFNRINAIYRHKSHIGSASEVSRIEEKEMKEKI